MPPNEPIPVVFFKSDSDRQPVREWLRDLDRESRKIIGEDIKTLQFGWPIGMPLSRKLSADIWGLRSRLAFGVARTFFTIYDHNIVLLHGFVKKTEKTPPNELATAKRRLTKLRSNK